jgi:hypothetical protein
MHPCQASQCINPVDVPGDPRTTPGADGPRPDTPCPRYFGAACHTTGLARIGLSWAGAATLRVTMDSPALEASPVIGGIPPPARGVLSTGQAVFGILDPAEYQRTQTANQAR